MKSRARKDLIAAFGKRAKRIEEKRKLIYEFWVKIQLLLLVDDDIVNPLEEKMDNFLIGNLEKVAANYAISKQALIQAETQENANAEARPREEQ